MPRLWRLLAPCLAAVAGIAACSGADDVVATATTTTTETTTTTSTTTTTTTTAPPAPPPVLVVAGDSIIYDVSPVLVDALEPDAARVIPLVTPALSADSNRVTLLSTVDEADPEVVIIMVGIWERTYETPEGAVLGDPGWGTAYIDDVIDPLAQEINANGGRLVLLGPPHIRVTADDAQIATLEQNWSDYADSQPGVRFVDSDSWLLDSEIFVELDGDDRIRRLDGIHLCAEGARRIAAGIIDEVSDELATAQTAPRPGWESGPWIERFPPDECPPAGT